MSKNGAPQLDNSRENYLRERIGLASWEVATLMNSDQSKAADDLSTETAIQSNSIVDNSDTVGGNNVSASENSVTASDALEEDTEPSVIPQRVYDLLPKSLRDATKFFDLWHEKDVYLLSMLGTLSAALPNVRFLYGKREHSPHLFLFILSEAASGKGTAQHAFDLLEKIGDMLRIASNKEREDWEQANDSYEKSRKSKESRESNGQLFEKPGEKPKERKIRVAGNITSAALHLRLEANPQGVFIGCTEGDTFITANQSEFGHFNDVIRTAYQHETLMVDRKGDGEVEIKRPRLALVFTGTPDQFPRLMDRGITDGLYSRFGVYRFKAPVEFVSQMPSEKDKQLGAFTDGLAEKARVLYETLASRSTLLEFIVSEEQWERVDSEFRSLHDELGEEKKYTLLPSVKRGAIQTHRIASIVATWRYFDAGTDLRTLEALHASDEDIEIGLLLGLMLTEHSITEAFNIQKNLGEIDPSKLMGKGRMTVKERELVAALPETFSTGEGKEKMESLGVNSNNFHNWMLRFIDMGILEWVEQGKYAKTGV